MKRVILGGLVAVFLAGSGSVFVSRLGIRDALCAAYPRESVEWYLFGCYLPKAPTVTHSGPVL